ncbi:hypothetical protein GYMLUDRAFT_36664 [Collybiopsis luxurians FD-317 M1]|nr:hypothetical protein GYMLUDRAFT_36664 [Collybiopsis luxurians FD-317 M1]
MQRRGRSRQVSRAALARKASEERVQRELMEELQEPVPPSAGTDLGKELMPAEVDRRSNVIDLTGSDLDLESSSLMVPSESYTYLYPPSVSPSPLTSAVATPDTSSTRESDSYFLSRSDEEPSSLFLLDQLHMAYALDDLPLAKILLLKITHGIQDITSRSDPRLDSVKPEDFDVAFLPKGGLMTPEDEARLAERQEKERKRIENEAREAREQARQYREKLERERREQEERDKIEREEKERAERERAWEGWVEGVWGNVKREMEEMREMKKLAKKRQEEAERVALERRRQEEERRRANAERRRTHAATTCTGHASVPRISYAHLPTTRVDSRSTASSSSAQPELLYTLPHIPKLSAQHRRLARTSDPLSARVSGITDPQPSPLRQSLFSSLASELVQDPSSQTFDCDDVQTHLTPVSVQEVLTAMRGPLFPTDIPAEPGKRNRSQHALHAKSKSDDLDLGFARARSQTPNAPSHSFNSISSSFVAVTRKQRREAALLAELLESGPQHPARDRLRSRRGENAQENAEMKVEMQRRNPLRTTSSSSTKSMCAACSTSLASPSASSTSSSVVSRTGSWLSFMSSSASSTSTVLTTPSASVPVSSPPMKSSIRTGSVFSTWLKNAGSQSNSSAAEQCTCDLHDVPCSAGPVAGNGTHLISVSKAESPLPLEEITPSCLESVSKEVVSRMPFAAVSDSQSTPSTTPNALVRSVSHFLDVAKTFQSAYMHAAVFAAVASVPNIGPLSSDSSGEYERSPINNSRKTVENPGSKLRPVGSRVAKTEVEIFVSTNKSSQQSGDTDMGEGMTAPSGFRPRITHPELFPSDGAVQYIPLVPPYNPENPPRTVLPNPLPFPIHFKPQRSLSGSPHRRLSVEQIQDRSYSKRRPTSPPRYGGMGRRTRRSPSRSVASTQPVPRPRFVGNPVYLRLKALQNCTGISVTDTQIVELHDEGVSIKGGILSCGREKVLGTAFEEVGRSRLSLDIFHVRTARPSVSLPMNSHIPWWTHRDNQLRWEDGSVRRGRSVVKG